MSPLPPREKPHVVIVGAGLGGLMLAQLLERQKISYVVLERATKIVPLGSAMSVGANILPVYEQLGMYDELLAITKSTVGAVIKDQRGDVIGVLDEAEYEHRTGYPWLIAPRPELHELFISKVPKEKVLYGKKAVSILHTDEKVSVECTDGSIYEGDILVGADGANSAVRASLFKELKAAGKLSASDQEPLMFRNACLVGTTDPLDPAKFPGVDGLHSLTVAAIADNDPRQCLLFGVPNNRVCWFMNERLTEALSKNNENFNSQDWGPEGTEKMVEEARSFPCPIAPGLTMGDLFDATPKGMISKVMLEEKMFDSWYSKRVVLIGDAAHKMLPDSGQGAVNAMQDAVVLANRIYDMSANTVEEMEAAFAAYRKERYPHAKTSVDNSNEFGKVFNGQSWFDKLYRKVALTWMPKWLNNYIIDSMHYYRPMVTYLPQISRKGVGKVLPQTPAKRTVILEQ
ncbi:hypothetical protein BGZ73_004833 [Actinomortierella ambigua]|nr:hypothetical protein BGZ73_004833 [Actinomortierella ambigua]